MSYTHENVLNANKWITQTKTEQKCGQVRYRYILGLPKSRKLSLFSLCLTPLAISLPCVATILTLFNLISLRQTALNIIKSMK